MAWQLGGGINNLKQYYALPIFCNQAIGLEMRKPLPLTGLIKTKLKMPVSFSFAINNDITVSKISILIGDDKKQQKEEPMNFTNNNGNISFSYEFKKEDIFPIKIMIDGQEVLAYLIEVKE